MPDTVAPEATTSYRARGRPRRLTLDQVVRAGVELGLEHLSISSIALRLGVGVATIYTYVENIDELRRIVAVALAKTETMKDVGQPWPEIVRTLAKDTFDILSHEPHLLAQIVSGALDPESAFREIEGFLTLLAARGFAEEDAFALYRRVLWISGGAAIGAAVMRSWERKGEARRVRLARARAEGELDNYPHLSKLGAAFFDDAHYTDFGFAIEELIERVAAERGEAVAEPSARSLTGEQ